MPTGNVVWKAQAPYHYENVSNDYRRIYGFGAEIDDSVYQKHGGWYLRNQPPTNINYRDVIIPEIGYDVNDGLGSHSNSVKKKPASYPSEVNFLWLNFI